MDNRLVVARFMVAIGIIFCIVGFSMGMDAYHHEHPELGDMMLVAIVFVAGVCISIIGGMEYADLMEDGPP